LGYSQTEIENVQARWSLRFPDDLVDLLQARRPLFPGGFDWIRSPASEIKRAIEWPFEGFLFDLEENDLWWPEWGERPATSGERREKLTEELSKAPKLIPLFGHRYLPDTPSQRGNPVFSVHQSDVIYYGSDLHDWLIREQDGWEKGTPIDIAKPRREIRFWSEAVRRNI
jgi:hypothetical protein